ncbi:MAG TPA: hypothetical protein VFM98_23510 [Ramlibacter sp.]|uniref:hypothetical protein n=1 Tax=Ramlibacter sp. TaxID=1917967 RepID=UPI002D7F017B|nr:hypothetical protein [Ramlibacter sp.]HET8748582.1 hypothetical protein [Ramlibacter sp.]
MQPSLSESTRRSTSFDLVAAIDAYEDASTRLVARWLDMDLYSDVSRQIDAIRERGVSDPSLTVFSLQLVIAHSELICTMWQNSSVGVSAAKLQEVQARHTLAVRALREAVGHLSRVD